MTTDQIDDDALATSVTASLHHRAARVAVDDRLDSITDGLGVVGGLAPVHELARPSHRRRTAPRLLFAAAAVLVAAGLSLALWQRGAQEPLVPVSGPTSDVARIYPILDAATLAGIGLDPDPAFGVKGALQPTTGPALVLRPTTGERPGDVITVWVAAPIEPGDGGVVVSPPDPAGLGSGDLMLEPVRIGDRTVRRPYGDTTGPVDLMVWLDATASDADVEAVRTFLADSSLVHSSTYKGQDAMWAEFQRAYADQPQVLDVVEADDLPTAFEVDLEVDDSTSIAELQSELQAFSGVTMATPGAAFERYEWDEAGATIVVDGSHGSGSAVEAVVAGLTVTPQDDQPPFVTMTNLPDGWVVLAGPSAPTADPVPVLNFLYGTGNGSLNVTRQPSFDVQHPLIPVTVGGRAGYLTEPEGQGFTLTWALEEEGWWAQLVGYGASRDQALALAEAVTFTDKADWSSLYPLEASTAATSALSPPTTTATTEP